MYGPMGKIFCVEFQRVPLKFHTKYLTHTLKDTIFIQRWNFKKLISVFEMSLRRNTVISNNLNFWLLISPGIGLKKNQDPTFSFRMASPYLFDFVFLTGKLFLSILNTYLRHRTAPIFTSGQLATSGAIWTCWGSTRTCNISHNRLRCCLLQPRDGCILFVTCTRSNVTCVSIGAAVDTIRATHSLWHRTAPIFTSGQLATSGAIWTCWGSTRTRNISYNRLRCCLLQPRDGCILFVTCTRSNVTCVSVGAAVDTIWATHSLHKQGEWNKLKYYNGITMADWNTSWGPFH